jgi:fumarate reductase subunit D
MAFPTHLSADTAHNGHVIGELHDSRPPRSTSAVSWGAIAAGAAAAAALSLILLILGVGLGLSSVSPWANAGVTAATLGVSTIVWLTVTQLLASAMGGYLAGRLRTKWVDTQADEVYFRDTAHGFLAWAVASLATAALLTSVIGSIVGGGVQAGATVAGGATVTATAAATGIAQNEEGGSMAYFVDTLFRRDAGVVSASTAAPGDTASSYLDNERELAEIGRILMFHKLSEPLPEDDVRHVGQLVAQRTGLSQADAEKRVTDTYARAQSQVREAETDARAAADAARKASSTAALWLFVSLLIGAFCASLAATFGGRQRDA